MTLRRTPGQVHRRYDTTLAALEKFGSCRNMLANGCMRVAQRGTSITSATYYDNADDSYTLDRWLLLSDGDDRVDITQDTSVVPDGAYASMLLDVETVGSPSEKFGICQIIEARDTARLWKNATGVVSLSFQAWSSTSPSKVENIRAAVLAWDGVADTVTSDVVSAWNAEGANPTFAANWTAENTASNLALGDDFKRFVIEGIKLDTAGTTNLAVFIWVDDTDLIATDPLYITEVQLEAGQHVTPFELRTFSEEVALCQRYFCKTFLSGTTPAQGVGLTSSLIDEGRSGSGEFVFTFAFPVQMRAQGSVTTFNPESANNDARNNSDNTDVNCTVTHRSSSFCCITGGAADDALDDIYVHACAQSEM